MSHRATRLRFFPDPANGRRKPRCDFPVYFGSSRLKSILPHISTLPQATRSLWDAGQANLIFSHHKMNGL
jgi:hypothetical protein